MIYIMGDTHRRFTSIEDFCHVFGPTRDDVLVILGDAGINYYGCNEDRSLKRYLAGLPISLFCVHGNHEQRPGNIRSYDLMEWRGGTVYFESEFPNLLFAKDGEVYELEGMRCIVIGGAFSVDKVFRLRSGYQWWEDEQPSRETKAFVEDRLESLSWQVDIVFSHTCPYKYLPRENLIFTNRMSFDNSTEQWLDTIENRLDYYMWYCGHFHIDKTFENIRFLSGKHIELADWLHR